MAFVTFFGAAFTFFTGLFVRVALLDVGFLLTVFLTGLAPAFLVVPLAILAPFLTALFFFANAFLATTFSPAFTASLALPADFFTAFLLVKVFAFDFAVAFVFAAAFLDGAFAALAEAEAFATDLVAAFFLGEAFLDAVFCATLFLAAALFLAAFPFTGFIVLAGIF